jgi:SNW domain-containing protein 1
MVEAQVDPMEPPKHKHKKVPKGPGSPPVPVLHSPPRKLTVADQQAWKVPPCISNWKNARGFTIPLDKRLAADGRGLQEVTINNKFATLSEALYISERKAAEDLRVRNQIRKMMSIKEKEDKEQQLREMALKSRMERAGISTDEINARMSEGISENDVDDILASREKETDIIDKPLTHSSTQARPVAGGRRPVDNRPAWMSQAENERERLDSDSDRSHDSRREKTRGGGRESRRSSRDRNNNDSDRDSDSGSDWESDSSDKKQRSRSRRQASRSRSEDSADKHKPRDSRERGRDRSRDRSIDRSNDRSRDRSRGRRQDSRDRNQRNNSEDSGDRRDTGRDRRDNRRDSGDRRPPRERDDSRDRGRNSDRSRGSDKNDFDSRNSRYYMQDESPEASNNRRSKDSSRRNSSRSPDAGRGNKRSEMTRDQEPQPRGKGATDNSTREKRIDERVVDKGSDDEGLEIEGETSMDKKERERIRVERRKERERQLRLENMKVSVYHVLIDFENYLMDLLL